MNSRWRVGGIGIRLIRFLYIHIGPGTIKESRIKGGYWAGAINNIERISLVAKMLFHVSSECVVRIESFRTDGTGKCPGVIVEGGDVLALDRSSFERSSANFAEERSFGRMDGLVFCGNSSPIRFFRQHGQN